MQWGDLKFTTDTLSSIFGSKVRNSNGWFGFEWMSGIKNLMREKEKSIYERVSTYHVKINYLLNLYKREKTSDNFEKLSLEMHHMKKMDTFFATLKHRFNLKGVYDGKNIDFTCLRRSVDLFESRCAKLEDYNLQYMKYMVENCEKNRYDSLLPIINEYCQ